MAETGGAGVVMGGGTGMGAGSVAEVLRRAREARVMTLRELAQRAAVSLSYLSQIENGLKVPEEAVLARLEGALGLAEGALAGPARWSRTPGEVKREVARLNGAREHLKNLVREVLRDPELAGMKRAEELRAAAEGDERGRGAAMGRAMPNGADAPDGTGGVGGGEEVGWLGAVLPLEVPILNPKGTAWPRWTAADAGAWGGREYLRVPDVRHADAFAVRVVGDAMEPEYRAGDLIVCVPARTAARGDGVVVRDGADCLAWERDGMDGTGEEHARGRGAEREGDGGPVGEQSGVRGGERGGATSLARVYWEGERVRLQPLNHRYRARVVARRAVELYPVVWVGKRVG